MKTLQKGFTLIELMIVVAIIAILAAIAIPAYQDYVIRSQVSEGMTLADGAKTAMAEFYTNYGHFPLNNSSAGLASPASITGKYVSGLSVATVPGVIETTFSSTGTHVASSKINALILALSAVAVSGSGSVTWHCATAKTTVPAKFLPSSCRGANQ
ncbi:MAG: pilin [Rhodanobacteraceae bacterium]|nr:pilin [Pseudomonadota bacterium]